MLTANQSEEYTTVCSLDYEYIKNHYRLITTDLSRQKELDADMKALQQIEFVGGSKNTNDVNGSGMVVILERIKEARLKFSQGSKCNSFTNDG